MDSDGPSLQYSARKLSSGDLLVAWYYCIFCISCLSDHPKTSHYEYRFLSILIQKRLLVTVLAYRVLLQAVSSFSWIYFVQEFFVYLVLMLQHLLGRRRLKCIMGTLLTSCDCCIYFFYWLWKINWSSFLNNFVNFLVFWQRIFFDYFILYHLYSFLETRCQLVKVQIFIFFWKYTGLSCHTFKVSPEY